jgi:hypothetical protein
MSRKGIMAAREATVRSSSVRVRRYRPCQAFVRSITQRFSSGVKPFVPSGRVFTMMFHAARGVALQASRS